MVEGGARTQPLELVRRHRVPHRDLECLPTATGHPQTDGRRSLTSQEIGEPERLDDVPSADATVVGLVDEPERQDALFL